MDTLSGAFEFLVDSANWSGRRGIIARGRAHLWISLVATTLSVVIALPLAVTLAHRRRFPVAASALVNVGRALPSFAIVALVYPFSLRFGFGLGFWPTTVALVALGIPPIFTNAYTGVAGTPAASVEAARGIGMTGAQILRRVELPAALPLVLGGVRTAAVQIVATATLGAIVGYECLGSFIVSGLRRGAAGRPSMLAGAILVAALALMIDVALGRLERRLTPWARVARPGRRRSIRNRERSLGGLGVR